ncbi:MAG: hypothetical protein COA79_22665 [Planctomycetota bacterium]|nr:MAG: hypothetical protein COA79_22665 [Planctomycetota bacterium]
MIKKLLNPLVVSAFVLVLMLGSFAHLMYGSCQTTKFHYICQAYWMPDYLPEWMIPERGLSLEDVRSMRTFSGFEQLYEDRIIVSDDYSGKWKAFYRDGSLKSEFLYNDGIPVSEERWEENGKLSKDKHYSIYDLELKKNKTK